MKINNAKTFLRAGALLAVAFTGANLAHAQSCASSLLRALAGLQWRAGT